jgi:hypothetical protein
MDYMYTFGVLGFAFGILGFVKAKKLEKDLEDLKKQLHLNK